MSIIIYASILHTAYCLTFKKLNFQKRHHKLRHKAQTALQSETKTSRVEFFLSTLQHKRQKQTKKKKENIEKIQKKTQTYKYRKPETRESAMQVKFIRPQRAHTAGARAALLAPLSFINFSIYRGTHRLSTFVFVDCRSKSSKSERIVGPRAIVIFRT